MSETLEVIKQAIELNQTDLLEQILGRLGVEEIDSVLFNELKKLLAERDSEYYKLEHTLRSQEVVEDVLKSKLL